MKLGFGLLEAFLLIYLTIRVVSLRMARRPILTASVTFGISWASVIGVYMLGWAGTSPTSESIAPTIGLFTVVVILGELLIDVTVGANSVARCASIPQKALQKLHVRLCLLLAAYTVLQILKIWSLVSRGGGLGALFGGSGIDIRRSLVSAEIERQSSSADGGLIVGAIGYCLLPGYGALFTGSLLWRDGTRRISVVPLLILVPSAVLTLQRAAIVYPLVIFVVCVQTCRNAQPRVRRRSLPHSVVAARLVAAAVGVSAVLIVPLQLRDSRTSVTEGLQSVALYAVSGLSALDRVAVGGKVDPSPVLPQLGGETFYGVNSVLGRLGVLHAPSAPNFGYVQIGKLANEPFYSNVYTGLIYPIDDFGLYGGLLLFLLLAMATTIMLSRRRNLGCCFAASVLLTTLLLSFFSLTPLRDLRYIVLMTGVAGYLGWRIPRLKSSGSLLLSFRDHMTTESQRA